MQFYKILRSVAAVAQLLVRIGQGIQLGEQAEPRHLRPVLVVILTGDLLRFVVRLFGALLDFAQVDLAEVKVPLLYEPGRHEVAPQKVSVARPTQVEQRRTRGRAVRKRLLWLRGRQRKVLAQQIRHLQFSRFLLDGGICLLLVRLFVGVLRVEERVFVFVVERRRQLRYRAEVVRLDVAHFARRQGESVGGFGGERGHRPLVRHQRVREHVASGGGQQVDLLQTRQREPVELRFGAFHVRLGFSEAVEAVSRVGVQLGRDRLHPAQRRTVLGPRLFHLDDGRSSVGDGSAAEGLHLVVQAHQRGAHGESLVARVSQGLASC
jgi:hypothetical protein